MILKSIVTIGLIGSLMAANAQSISPEVIATSGEHFQNGTSQLSWTLGEVMIDTYATGGNILTQGFHQTQLTVTSIEENNPFSLDVGVFPNPTTQFLNVNISGEHDPFVVALYDMNGRLVLENKIPKNQSSVQLDLSALAMAYYTLTISESEGDYFSAHKVCKSGGE